jgi:hypothetical protein
MKKCALRLPSVSSGVLILRSSFLPSLPKLWPVLITMSHVFTLILLSHPPCTANHSLWPSRSSRAVATSTLSGHLQTVSHDTLPRTSTSTTTTKHIRCIDLQHPPLLRRHHIIRTRASASVPKMTPPQHHFSADPVVSPSDSHSASMICPKNFAMRSTGWHCVMRAHTISTAKHSHLSAK